MGWFRFPGPGWLESSWDSVRSSYWFVPTWMAVLAAIVAEALLVVDRQVPPEWVQRLPWIFEASAEGTRATLSVVAGSMITVTGVVFSITIVALTLASNQFGPRVLRNFMCDRVNQFVLGTFVATFLYSLLVLRAVQSHDDVTSIPHIATGGAVALGVTSLFVLILFIHHAATSIQASSVIASIARDIQTGIPELFPERLGEGQGPSDLESWNELLRGGSPVRSCGSGYVRVVDGDSLLELAQKHDARIAIELRPGSFAAQQAVLARMSCPAEAPREELERRIRDAFVLGDRRTPVQDLLFPVEQLADLAVRALSPGINDPRTAIACIHRLGDALGVMAGRDDPSPHRRDEAGDVRILAPATRFEDVLAAGFEPIRRFGATDPQVAVALLEALSEAARRGVEGSRAEALRLCAQDILSTARDSLRSKRDLAQVEQALTLLESLLVVPGAAGGAA